MVHVLPFRALTPQSQYVDEVAAPPYDVMNRAEARDMIAGKNNSILRVTRPDAILDDQLASDDDQAYLRAQSELKRLISSGVLQYEEEIGYFIYTQQMGQHRQTGIIGLTSAEDYWSDRIKKHEFTLPKKEDDRTRQVLTLGAHLGPVFLTHEPHPLLKDLIVEYQQHPPQTIHLADDGIQHELWIVTKQSDIALIQKYYSELDALYIADGHHRAAAAARVSKDLPHSESAKTFLSVSFAADELLVLPYQRVVTELTYSVDEFKTKLSNYFDLETHTAPIDQDPSLPVQFPQTPKVWGMYLDGQWYTLKPNQRLTTEIKSKDPLAQLDVSILQDYVLRPLLHVDDPRTCEHINFVGGIRGFRALERGVQQSKSKGVAFALYPTSVKELMDIADRGEVMPPKSTWFEPKLRTGLVISVFDPQQTT